MNQSIPVIVVVDDDESVRRALRRLLKSAGFRVETFASGEDFLAYAQQETSGCIILDVRMLRLSGLEVQERLVASGSTVPIIFISAHDDAEAQSHAMQAGAVAFLQKPFTEKDLLDAIHKALERPMSNQSNHTNLPRRQSNHNGERR